MPTQDRKELLSEFDISEEKVEEYANKAKKYDWVNKQKDETILLWDHPFILELLSPILFSILIVATSVFLALYIDFSSIGIDLGVNLSLLSLLGIPFALILVSIYYVKWVNTHYVITSNRVIRKKNIFRPDPKEKDFSDVDSLDPKQGKEGIINGITEQLFGFGDIYVHSDSETILLDNVPNYSKYSKVLSNLNSKNSVREVVREQTKQMSGEKNANN